MGPATRTVLALGTPELGLRRTRAGHVLPARASLATSPDSGHSFPFKGSEVIITANEPPSPAGTPCLALPLRCPGLPWNVNTGGGREIGGRRGTMLRPPPRWLQALSSHFGPGQRGGHLHAFIPQTDSLGTDSLPQPAGSRPQGGRGGEGVPSSRESDGILNMPHQCPPGQITVSSKCASNPHLAKGTLQ